MKNKFFWYRMAQTVQNYLEVGGICPGSGENSTLWNGGGGFGGRRKQQLPCSLESGSTVPEVDIQKGGRI